MKIMINDESDISDYEEDDLNILEDESTSDNESEVCECVGNCTCDYKEINTINEDKQYEINTIDKDDDEITSLIDLVDKIKDPNTRKIYYDKLKEKLGKTKVIEENNIQIYNFDEICKRFKNTKPITINDLQIDLGSLCKPLYDRLKKNPKPWTEDHTKVVRNIKNKIKELPCLNIPHPDAYLIVETDASDIGYGGILKQRLKDSKTESLVRFYSGSWNDTQKNYSTVKKEILSIVLNIKKFEDDLYMKPFLLRIDCLSAKSIIEKDVKNLISKQIFARWQALLRMNNSDKKIVLPRPRLPSPSSPLTQTQNRFIALTPYPPTQSSITRPTYSELARLQGMPQNPSLYNRSPTTATTSSSSIPRSPSSKPEFQVLAGYNQYKILFKQETVPSFEYSLQFFAIFKLPWILSFTHKKQEAEGSSPPLLLRQFSVKWWKQIEESQANKEAVIKYHSSLIQESPRISISTTKFPMTNMDIAKKIKECENKQELERLINEIRRSPTPSEDLFQDSQDPYDDYKILDD
ncbi:reverse transcriptase domain, zinc finger, CCHC-type, aspartic peptidase domain protein [Tanacetum coccineum]|uniref:Reverse transcriptase domain, zinc finger, CCHC-type, aspartic peptidase domain protein n=1 Tax=Tanacetum coccineum TaxID=301880 RepID=A0ABQ5CT87_9ASTR